ncbi:M23 family metallopeptidase [Naumannella sp. ID2617S]|nr:M23 family metallopeptidase [Naumannella sp. ID2617S]
MIRTPLLAGIAAAALLALPGVASAEPPPSPTPAASPSITATPSATATPSPTPAAPLAPPPCAPLPAGSYAMGARWGAHGSWAQYHTGQDFAAPVGTPVRAVADGVVLTPNGGAWAGVHVVIRHADGSASMYTFMSQALVKPGDRVTAGQQIGAVGLTGRTFGPHLHLEHYPSGVVGNPYTTDDPYTWLLTRPCEKRVAPAGPEHTGGLAKTGS